MSNIPQGSVCDKCGGGVGLNEEGRIVCEGCNNTTDLCTCAEASEQGEAAGGTA